LSAHRIKGRQERALTNSKTASVSEVQQILQEYASRQVFRGFTVLPARPRGKQAFEFVWHHGLHFELIVDRRNQTLHVPALLEGVLPSSPLHKELKAWLSEQSAEERPPHRRLDRSKASLRCVNHGGRIALTLTAKDGDMAYSVRRLVGLMHELFVLLLANPVYADYRRDQLGTDPDRG
jgi:hypothetical protein